MIRVRADFMMCVRARACSVTAEEDSDETKAWVESQTKASALEKKNKKNEDPSYVSV